MIKPNSAHACFPCLMVDRCLTVTTGHASVIECMWNILESSPRSCPGQRVQVATGGNVLFGFYVLGPAPVSVLMYSVGECFIFCFLHVRAPLRVLLRHLLVSVTSTPDLREKVHSGMHLVGCKLTAGVWEPLSWAVFMQTPAWEPGHSCELIARGQDCIIQTASSFLYAHMPAIRG